MFVLHVNFHRIIISALNFVSTSPPYLPEVFSSVNTFLIQCDQFRSNMFACDYSSIFLCLLVKMIIYLSVLLHIFLFFIFHKVNICACGTRCFPSINQFNSAPSLAWFCLCIICFQTLSNLIRQKFYLTLFTHGWEVVCIYATKLSNDSAYQFSVFQVQNSWYMNHHSIKLNFSVQFVLPTIKVYIDLIRITHWWDILCPTKNLNLKKKFISQLSHLD